MIEAKIREHVARTCGVVPGDDVRLVEHGYVPSIRLLELVGFLEDEFAIKLRPVDLLPEKLATIATIAEMVRQRLPPGR